MLSKKILKKLKKRLAKSEKMCYYIGAEKIRVWRSLVSRLNGVQEAASSNLVTRTKSSQAIACDDFFFIQKCCTCASSAIYTERYRSGAVCERRRWRIQRAKRRGSGQNLVSECEQQILGTATGHNGADSKTKSLFGTSLRRSP